MHGWKAFECEWDRLKEKHPVVSQLLIWLPTIAAIDAMAFYLVLNGSR
jgi:hypothetical protein